MWRFGCVMSEAGGVPDYARRYILVTGEPRCGGGHRKN